MISSQNIMKIEVFITSTKEIKEYLYNFNITSVFIDSNVSVIGKNAFKNCGTLIKISIPNSISHIGYGAFINCLSLEEIEIPSSVKNLEANTFNECISLKKITVSSKTNLSSCCFGNGIISLQIKGSIEIIPQQLFGNCKSLQNISLPKTIISINDLAFHHCALTEITIPSSVKIIYLTCFENCLKLKKITFDSNDTKIVLNRNFCNQYPIIYLKSLEFLTFSSINSLNIDKSKRNPLYSGSNLYSSIFNNFDGETQKSIFFLLLQIETNKLSYKGYPNDSQIYVVFLLLQNISEKLNENLNNDSIDILINHKAMDIIIDVAYFDNDSDSEKEKEEFDEDSDSYLDDVSIDITNILPLNYKRLKFLLL